jgi:hypothetical protein
MAKFRGACFVPDESLVDLPAMTVHREQLVRIISALFETAASICTNHEISVAVVRNFEQSGQQATYLQLRVPSFPVEGKQEVRSHASALSTRQCVTTDFST